MRSPTFSRTTIAFMWHSRAVCSKKKTTISETTTQIFCQYKLISSLQGILPGFLWFKSQGRKYAKHISKIPFIRLLLRSGGWQHRKRNEWIANGVLSICRRTWKQPKQVLVYVLCGGGGDLLQNTLPPCGQ